MKERWESGLEPWSVGRELGVEGMEERWESGLEPWSMGRLLGNRGEWRC